MWRQQKSVSKPSVFCTKKDFCKPLGFDAVLSLSLALSLSK